MNHKVIIPWSEFKKAAYKELMNTYPNLVDDDTVQFVRFSPEGPRMVAEEPETVIITLEIDKTS